MEKVLQFRVRAWEKECLDLSIGQNRGQERLIIED